DPGVGSGAAAAGPAATGSASTNPVASGRLPINPVATDLARSEEAQRNAQLRAVELLEGHAARSAAQRPGGALEPPDGPAVAATRGGAATTGRGGAARGGAAAGRGGGVSPGVRPPSTAGAGAGGLSGDGTAERSVWRDGVGSPPNGGAEAAPAPGQSGAGSPVIDRGAGWRAADGPVAHGRTDQVTRRTGPAALPARRGSGGAQPTAKPPAHPTAKPPAHPTTLQAGGGAGGDRGLHRLRDGTDAAGPAAPM